MALNAQSSQCGENYKKIAKERGCSETPGFATAPLLQFPMGEVALGVGKWRHGVAVAGEDPLVDGQPLQSDGAAGMDFCGGDADFGAQAKAEPVGKAG